MFDAPFEPSLTLGFAYGSGDEDADDGHDGNFRQTGLQDNTDSRHGLASFPYYGVVLQPELSNLAIVTAGLGLRPTEQTSIDRQNDPDDDLREVDLDADPNGNSGDLGQAIDLVLAYEPTGALSFEANCGWFGPGDAFDEATDPAFFAGFETIFRF